MEVKEFFEKNLEFLRGQEIVKCLYMNINYDYLSKLAKELEFNHKGAGLITLAKLLDVDFKDTIAIGDNFNDLSMIQVAGLGIGVQNTVEQMKPLCDVITKATCNENALTEIMNQYVLQS